MSEMSYTGLEEEDEDGMMMSAVYDDNHDKSRYLDTLGEEEVKDTSKQAILADENL